jgi:hypothetical protein
MNPDIRCIVNPSATGILQPPVAYCGKVRDPANKGPYIDWHGAEIAAVNGRAGKRLTCPACAEAAIADIRAGVSEP